MQKQALDYLLIHICSLSKISNDVEAFDVICKYSFSPLIRCIAINKVSRNSGGTSGFDTEVLNNDMLKLNCYKKTNVLKVSRKSNKSKTDILKVVIPKANGGSRNIGISNIVDRVLQTQMCILLDAFYEAKYHENVFGFRKGRNTLQAIALLSRIIDSTEKDRLGVALLDIKGCFDKIPHNVIIKYFKVPKI